MGNNSIFRFAGWSAYLSGLADILILVASLIFAVAGSPFDTISAFAEIFWVLLIMPIALAFHQQLRSTAPLISLIAFVIGIIGISYSTVITFLLNFGPKNFGDSGVFINATIGSWFLITNSLLILRKLQPLGLSVLGMLIGTSYTFSIVALWFKGPWMTVFAIHIFALLLLYPIWAFWVGRVLLKSNSLLK
jgi:hypothetical protein